MADPIKNRHFEEPDASGTPGEAEYWIWTSSQAMGAWAEFNAAMVEFLRCREDFEGDWDDNQDWIADLSDAIVTVTLFNVGGGSYESMFESFELWGDLTSVWLPWFDVEPTMLAPYQVVSPPAPASAVGWDSWYSTLFGGVLAPLAVESFEESWENEPFSTSAAYQWTPGTCVDGLLRGAPLTFPVRIEPNRNDLWFVRGAPLTIYQLALTPGDYATVGDLVAELNAALAITMALTTHALAFGSHTDPETGAESITFGWDQATTGSEGIVLAAAPGDDYWRDARATLGFASFDPRGRENTVSLPVSILVAPPPGAQPDDVWWMDVWSLLVFRTEYDVGHGGWYAIDYNLVGALFASEFWPGLSVVETFHLIPWYGSGWVSEYTPPDLTAVLFNDYGLFTPTTLESFEEAWDEEPFPF